MTVYCITVMCMNVGNADSPPYYVALILFYVTLPRLNGFAFNSSPLATGGWTETVIKLDAS